MDELQELMAKSRQGVKDINAMWGHPTSVLAQALLLLDQRLTQLEQKAAGESAQAWFRPATEADMQSSQEQSPTTASPTTVSPSGALDGLTPVETQLLLRVLGVLTEAERIHAGQCSACLDLLGQFLSRLSTHVPDAGGINSISQSQGSSPSAGASGSAAAMSQSESSKDQLVDDLLHWQEEHDWFHGRQSKINRRPSIRDEG